MTNRLRNEDSGAVYVLMVLAIFVLMAMAAFAVDLGWIFLNKSRAQRAADSAALAGVTALPAEPATAIARAIEYAKLNGYDNSDPSIVVSPAPTADNELRVQVDADIDTIFMKVFGIDTVHIDVAAKARYIASVPLGNPDNIFGPEPGTAGQNFTDVGFWPAITFQYDEKGNGDPYATKCTHQITSGVNEGLACGNPPDNAEYYGSTLGEPDGYWYAVEVPSGTSNLSVQVYDAGYGQAGLASDDQVFPEETSGLFTSRNEVQRVVIDNAQQAASIYRITIDGETTSDITVNPGGGAALDAAIQALPSISSVAIDATLTEDPAAGDYSYPIEINNPARTDFPLGTCDAAGLVSQDGVNPATCTVVAVTDGGTALASTTTYRLYAPDDTPFDIRDNGAPICELTGTNELAGSPTNYSWTTLCSISGSVTPGLYPLRIFAGPGRSWNEFSLRANASGDVRIYALEDLSIASSIAAGKTRFFLAEVAEQYRGLTFVVELFDPGDASGNNSISIVGPDGTIWNPGCHIDVDRDSVGHPTYPEDQGDRTPCTLNTTRPANDFQADWVKFTIPLPGDYSCPVVDGEPFCWWKVEYNYSGKAGERTTWRASVEGSQVALVFEPEPNS